MKMKRADQEDIFNYLENINPAHLKEGLTTLLLVYLQELIDEGMHVSLDRKFYEDIESLLGILTIREKYPFEKRTDNGEQ